MSRMWNIWNWQCIEKVFQKAAQWCQFMMRGQWLMISFDIKSSTKTKLNTFHENIENNDARLWMMILQWPSWWRWNFNWNSYCLWVGNVNESKVNITLLGNQMKRDEHQKAIKLMSFWWCTDILIWWSKNLLSLTMTVRTFQRLHRKRVEHWLSEFHFDQSDRFSIFCFSPPMSNTKV